MCFVKMLRHNVDSPNAPKGAPHHEFFWWVALTHLELPHAMSFRVQVGYVNNHRHETHFCSKKKKSCKFSWIKIFSDYLKNLPRRITLILIFSFITNGPNNIIDNIFIPIIVKFFGF